VELSAVFQAHPGGGDAALDAGRLADHDLLGGNEIAVHAAVDKDRVSVDISGNIPLAADGHAVALELDGPLDLAFDDQILFPFEFAVDMDRRADHGRAAGAGSAWRRARCISGFGAAAFRPGFGLLLITLAEHRAFLLGEWGCSTYPRAASRSSAGKRPQNAGGKAQAPA